MGGWEFGVLGGFVGVCVVVCLHHLCNLRRCVVCVVSCFQTTQTPIKRNFFKGFVGGLFVFVIICLQTQRNMKHPQRNNETLTKRHKRHKRQTTQTKLFV